MCDLGRFDTRCNRLQQAVASGSSPSERCERGSILVTPNLPFDEWAEVFGSDRSAAG